MQRARVAQRTEPKSRPARHTACWPASQLTEQPPQVVVGGAEQDVGPMPGPADASGADAERRA